MEPIPYYYDNINRSALVVKPKQPFIDWLASIESENKNVEEDLEGDVYLLPDFEEISQMKIWLKKNYDAIFSDQLNNWYTDEACWPQHRTFSMFAGWFEYSLHTMILDTEETPIVKL
jgi:hypothetical protein